MNRRFVLVCRVEFAVTELLYNEDAYLREFDATVVETTAAGVVLDRTAFYPGGGGQPPDTGVLRADGVECRVKRVSRSGGVLVHKTGSGGPAAGAAVHGVLDWSRRLELMRTHTALHVLCGVVWRDFGAQVTGGDMKPLSARMDFELEHMTADFARDVEELINAEVAAARPVRTGTLPREEAFQIPDLIRTKINLLPASIEEVRTVEIVGLDLQADGGIHVANTGEVGHIRVVKHESKGRINKRLRIAID
jgi:misacylated tRNA(Ala) deacylase